MVPQVPYYFGGMILSDIEEDLIYWECLLLKRRKLAILEFEVMKYYRRKKVLPI